MVLGDIALKRHGYDALVSRMVTPSIWVSSGSRRAAVLFLSLSLALSETLALSLRDAAASLSASRPRQRAYLGISLKVLCMLRDAANESRNECNCSTTHVQCLKCSTTPPLKHTQRK
jgi:hypothetical protein